MNSLTSRKIGGLVKGVARDGRSHATKEFVVTDPHVEYSSKCNGRTIEYNENQMSAFTYTLIR